MQGVITIWFIKTMILNFIPMSIAEYSQEAEVVSACLRNQSPALMLTLSGRRIRQHVANTSLKVRIANNGNDS